MEGPEEWSGRKSGKGPTQRRGAVSPSIRSFSAGNCSRVVATFPGSKSTVSTCSPAPAPPGPPPRIDHDRVTGLGNARVRAGRSTGEHERLVLDRAGLGEQRPVGAAPLGPAGREDEGLGAGVDEPAEELGEAEVVAGGDAEGGLRQTDRHQFGARAHQYGLALVEAEAVDLAVGGGQVAGGGEDEGGVVERAVGVPFGDRPGVQPGARVARRLRHDLERRPFEGLRLRTERLVGERAGGPQFRQHDEIDSGLFSYQSRHTPPTRIDRFAVVYVDLEERGAHTTTVLAFEPSIQAYDRHTKALPGCLTAA